MEIDTNLKVHKYLQELTTEHHVFTSDEEGEEEDGRPSSNSSGSYDCGEAKEEEEVIVSTPVPRKNSTGIPTRHTDVMSGAIQKAPLQYIGGSLTTSLTKQALEQTAKVEQMKAYKEQMMLKARVEGGTDMEDEHEWQNSLDAWRAKRQKASVDTEKAHLNAVSKTLLENRKRLSSVNEPSTGVDIVDDAISRELPKDDPPIVPLAQENQTTAVVIAESNTPSPIVLERSTMSSTTMTTTRTTTISHAKLPSDEMHLAGHDSGLDTNRDSVSPGESNSISPRSSDNGIDHHGKGGVIAEQKWQFQHKFNTHEDIEERMITIELQRAHGDGRPTFGFTVGGGKNKCEPIVVDSVVLGSAADVAGLRVGDQVQRVNGEEVVDKYLAKVNHALNEAMKLQEVELIVRRGRGAGGRHPPHRNGGAVVGEFSNLTLNTGESTISGHHSEMISPAASAATSVSSFDSRRALFNQPASNSIKPQSTRTTSAAHTQNRCRSTDRQRSPWQTNPMRNPAAGRAPNSSVNSSAREKTPDPFLTSHQMGNIRDFVPDAERAPPPIPVNRHEFVRHSPPMHGNYRVSSLTPERHVGRLSDFVPENERSTQNRTVSVERVKKQLSPILRNGDASITVNGYASMEGSRHSPEERIVERATQHYQQGEEGHDQRDVCSPSPPTALLTTTKRNSEEEHSIMQSYEQPSFAHRLAQIVKRRWFVRSVKRSSVEVAEEPRRIHMITRHCSLGAYDRSARTKPTLSLNPCGSTSADRQEAPQFIRTTNRIRRQHSVLVIRVRQSNEDRKERKEQDETVIRERFSVIKQQSQPRPGVHSAPAVTPTSAVVNAVHKQLHCTPDDSAARYIPRTTHGIRRGSSGATRLTDQLSAMTTTTEHKVNGNAEPQTTPSPAENNNGVLAISGKQKCAHCDSELGKGAAMIVESLSLFYHLACFKCYVCGMTLGTGACGADVRVKMDKLHCSACYSNDEAGWKYSEV